MGLSPNKDMATVSRNARGNDYSQAARTIDGENYDELVDQFNDDLRKKRSHLAK